MNDQTLTRNCEALRVLLIDSNWLFDEMENGNYHSAHEFLWELWNDLCEAGYDER